MWQLPRWEVQYFLDVPPSADRFPILVDRYRETWAKIFGGIAVLSGAWFAWRRLEIRREGQVTERFSRAVDQLGSTRADVRVGGIYALERIARDSAKDHPQVMEVLTAFIRQATSKESGDTVETDGESEADQSAGNVPIPDEAPGLLDRKPRRHRFADVQAALTVLARRELAHEADSDFLLNLAKADLRYAYLRKAGLAGAILANADLRAADLREANLSGVVNLTDADLTAAFLSDADLVRAWMLRATVTGADLRGSNLTNAMLAGVSFHNANLAGVNLHRAGLYGANLTDADLKNANLTEARLDAAVFRGANLKGADLTNSTLDKTDLRGAENLTREQVESAELREQVQLPNYLTETN